MQKAIAFFHVKIFADSLPMRIARSDLPFSIIIMVSIDAITTFTCSYRLYLFIDPKRDDPFLQVVANFGDV